jgi:hypothetical protein
MARRPVILSEFTPGNMAVLADRRSSSVTLTVTLTRDPGVLHSDVNPKVGEAERDEILLVLALANVDRHIGDEALVLTGTGCFGWMCLADLRIVT